MLQTYDGISDLNFSVGHPLQVEDFGELKPVFVDPPIDALDSVSDRANRPHPHAGQPPTDLRLSDGRLVRLQLFADDEARFRVNIFRQQGHFSIVMRKLQAKFPSSEGFGAAADFRGNREGKNRPDSGHRRDRKRQDDYAGRVAQ